MNDKRLRLGIDLGGTKIEIIALDPRGARAPAPADSDAARRLPRHARRARGAGARRRARARPPGDGRHRHTRLDLARDGPVAGLQLGVPQRPAVQARPRGRARARGARDERRELLRALRGDRRRRRGRRRRLRRDPRHRRRRRASSCTAACSTVRTASPANGATTRCPGPRTANGRAARASAGVRGASRPGCRVPASSAITSPRRASRRARKTSRRARRSATPTCAATLARYEERLARAIAHVINVLDPDVIVLGGGMSNIERLYANVPKLWGAWVFSDRVDTRLAAQRARRFERRARRGLAVGRAMTRDAGSRARGRGTDARRARRTRRLRRGRRFLRRAVDRRQSTRLQWSRGGAKLTSGRVPRVRGPNQGRSRRRAR